MTDPTLGPPEPPHPPAPLPPARDRGASLRRFAIPLAVVLVVGVVAAGRVLLRDKPETLALETVELKPTGRTAPVDVDPLPAGLKQEGTYTCVELRRSDGTHTARAEGASIRNGTDTIRDFSFTFTVVSGATSASVGRAFRMQPQDGAPSFLMASKSVPKGITRCRLRLEAISPGPGNTASGPGASGVGAVTAAAKRAGCSPPQTHAIEGASHIETGARGRYGTEPPSSGTHWASQTPPAPSPTGVHTKPIPNESQVHNLEHGHVGVQYRSVGDDAVTAMRTAAAEQPDWIFVAPYPDMPQRIALTAWGVSLSCESQPKDPATITDLVRAFVATYRNRAPESVPGMPA